MTSVGQIRFLQQPAEHISETLGLITALAAAAASILQWNRATWTSRWRNSNSAWKKQTHKQHNSYHNEVQTHRKIKCCKALFSQLHVSSQTISISRLISHAGSYAPFTFMNIFQQNHKILFLLFTLTVQKSRLPNCQFMAVTFSGVYSRSQILVLLIFF